MEDETKEKEQDKEENWDSEEDDGLDEPAVGQTLTIMRLTGVWSAKGGYWRALGPIGVALYGAYTLYAVLCMFLVVGSMLTAAVQGIGDASLFGRLVCMMTQTLAASIKALVFVTQRTNALRLLRSIRVLKREAAALGPEGPAIVSACAREARIVTRTFVSLGGITFSLWYATPAVLKFVHALRPSMPANDYVNSLPTEGWFPFDHRHGFGYIVAYFFEVWSVFLAYMNTSQVDSFIVASILHLSAHIRVLAARVRRIDGERALGACVRYHQHIQRSVNYLQTVLGAPVLTQFVFALAIICFVLFSLSQGKGGVARHLQLLTFLVTMAAEVLIHCWYGERILSASQELLEAVYESPWLDTPLPCQKSLVLVMVRAQRPFTLTTALGFNELSRATFLSILQASYSFFTVISSANE